jgi:hypothetical protein
MDAIQVVRIAFGVISERLLVILAMCMNCGLACWAMWGLGWERLVALTVFAIFSYLMLKLERNKNARQERPNTEE